MKIVRDGKEYELTFSEMIQAHEEFEFDCMIEDIKGLLESGSRDIKLSEEDIGEVASFALHDLSKNDAYYDVYWMSVEYTLDNYINNMSVDEEEDDE